MSTFFRENKGKWIILPILVACLVGIRYINIYHVWYSLTPWKNLGAPPKAAQKIFEIDLPGENEPPLANVYVKGPDLEFYKCCDLTEDGGWAPSDKPYYKFYGQKKLEPGICAERIRFEWGINEAVGNVKQSLDAGLCTPRLYSVFQIKNDGTVRGKTISETVPGLFKRISFEFLFWLIFIDLLLLGYKVIKANQASNQGDFSRSGLISSRLVLIVLIVAAMASLSFRCLTDVDERIRREIPGGYLRSFGTFAKYTLVIQPDHTYHMTVTSEGRGPFEREGTYIIQDGRVKFANKKEEYPNEWDEIILNNIFSGRAWYIPIKWGERLYLVEEVDMIDFCENQFDSEPRQYPGGMDYLRRGDWDIPVEGEPLFMDGNKACP